MKNKILLTAAAVVLLFSGCNRQSAVASYRFSGEKELHEYQVKFNWWATEYTLFVDGQPVLNDMRDGSSTNWNGKKLNVRMFYSPGFVFFGNYMTVFVFVDNEKVAEVQS